MTAIFDIVWVVYWFFPLPPTPPPSGEGCPKGGVGEMKKLKDHGFDLLSLLKDKPMGQGIVPHRNDANGDEFCDQVRNANQKERVAEDGIQSDRDAVNHRKLEDLPTDAAFVVSKRDELIDNEDDARPETRREDEG